MTKETRDHCILLAKDLREWTFKLSDAIVKDDVSKQQTALKNADDRVRALTKFITI